MTGALLALGVNYVDLHETVTDGIWAFTNACGRATESVLSPQPGDPDSLPVDDAIRTATIALALIGFLDAAAAQADFWKAGGRLGLIQKIKQLLSEPFLVAVETALSTIRNSSSNSYDVREWKRLLRHYSYHGRPLGAMLLQRGFMWLVLSSSSLMVAGVSSLQKSHVLDLLMSGESEGLLAPDELLDSDLRSTEVYSSIAAEQMDYLEAGADFVRLGSPDQQKLAYDIKSAAMIAYLNCAFLNEDSADVDVLMGWLQETLEDASQMADPSLASVVLRCLALVCRIAPSYASTVSRSLPRFLIQAAPHGGTVKVASKSLAFVLGLLSKDTVISTLYSLGNVLSPDSEASIANGKVNGVAESEETPSAAYTRRSMENSVALEMNGDQETTVVYGNVVQAICVIATTSGDEKITALAQSMLLQKLDKVNASVDAKVIIGAAKLALHGGQLEFRTLLKMYSRICHMGVLDQKEFLLGAVRVMKPSVFPHLTNRHRL